MKNILLASFVIMFAFAANVNSQTILNPLDLQVRLIDPTEAKGPIKRVPIALPSLFIDGYNLYFETPCDGCMLVLKNEDGETEYATVIPSNTTYLTLPSSLSGEYELQLIRGNFCFYGIIEL